MTTNYLEKTRKSLTGVKPARLFVPRTLRDPYAGDRSGPFLTGPGSRGREVQPFSPRAWRNISSTTMSKISPRVRQYSSTFHGSLV